MGYQVRAIAGVLVTLFALATSAPVEAYTSFECQFTHKLKGRIIRALGVHPVHGQRVLVGNKASQPSSALVFESWDRGLSWRTLNGARSLHPQATDVQAVAYGGGATLFAGTWKHGLYRSDDNGNGFTRVTSLAASDIRSIVVDPARAPGTVYVATGNQGVYVSHDSGQSWQGLGLAGTFVWAITLFDGQLYAASPNKGLFAFDSAAGTWRQSFGTAGASGRSQHRLAAKDGLYELSHDGVAWTVVEGTGGQDFASVLSADAAWYAGSWSGGLWLRAPNETKPRMCLEKATVVHVNKAANMLLAGSWGKGLYLHHPRSMRRLSRRPKTTNSRR